MKKQSLYYLKILSVFLVLALVFTYANLSIAPADAVAEKYDLNGWDKEANPNPKWTDGNLSGYQELELVPFKLEVENYNGSETSISIQHDYMKDSYTGYAEASEFIIAPDFDRLPVSADALYTNDGSVFSVTGPTIISGSGGVQVIEYTFSIIDPDALKNLDDGKGNFSFYWKAKLAGPNQASSWQGATIHTHTSVTGQQDIPLQSVDPVSTGAIEITKTIAGGGAQAGVTFKLYKGTGETRVKIGEAATDANGKITFGNLLAGSDYYLEEILPAGYTTDLSSAAITVTAGQTAPISVVNTLAQEEDKPGAIEITKTIAGGGAQAGVTFKLYKGTGETRVKIGEAATDANGKITFGNLLAGGDYYLEEILPAGYTTDLSSAAITVTADQTTPVSVVNTANQEEPKPGAIEITKTIAGGGAQAGVTFKLYKGTGEIRVKLGETATDANGKVTFSELEAGNDYYLEEVVPTGYTTNLSSAAITVTAGQTAQVSVINTITGGGNTDDGNTGGNTDSGNISSGSSTSSSSYPGIKLEKTADRNVAKVGDIITYTYTITNTGDYTLKNITVTDDVIGEIVIEAASLSPGQKTQVTAVYTVVGDNLPGPLVNTAYSKGYYGSSFVKSTPVSASVQLIEPITVPAEPPVEVPLEEEKPIPPQLPYTGGPTAVYTGLGIAITAIGILLKRRF